MVLNLNINDITQPVLKEAGRSSWLKSFLINSIESFLLRKISKLNNAIEDTILKVEGTHKHLKELSPESASKMLPEIKLAIVSLEKQYNRLEKINFFNNSELKSKYKYLLKSIYTSEAITHKITYRKKETQKTDKAIKTGIIKMNSSLLMQSV
jgi:hypothetical protein